MTSTTTDRRFGVNGGLAIKAPVRVATTANITLSGLQTIDSVALAADDRVLVKDQTSGVDNGIWIASTGSWSRAVDANGNRDFVKGTNVYITDGSTLGGTYWAITSTGTITIGTTSIAWTRVLTSSLSSLSFLQSGTGTDSRGAQDKMREIVNVLDYIDPSLHAAIAAYTSTYDATADYNQALADHPVVYAPPGLTRVTRPINMSARRSASTYLGRRLIGAGADRTRIDAYTGNYPCVDCTGQNTGAVVGINFRSDNPPSGFSATDCASIGLQMGRGAVSTSCNQMYLLDLRFNLTSDMTRNAANGTIGVCNDGAEHIIADQLQIYANLPRCSHNGLQFVVSRSSNITTYGADYEQAYGGAAISCTIHEWRNCQFISYDSYRAVWDYQVANVEHPNLYTSTRKLVSLVPSQTETFYLTGSCANYMVRCYQETSGLFGATYRMDHRYITTDGLENPDIVIQRAVSDMGFTLPGASSSSLHLLNNARVANGRINCNYTIGMYNASGDNNGFAALPVTFAGTPNSLKNLGLTFDHSGSHSAAVFSAIGPYCTNVVYTNYYAGDTRRCDTSSSLGNSFVPVAIGLTIAGAGTYTLQSGFFERSGGWCFFNLAMAWTAHTGTGGLAITGLPYTADANLSHACSVDYDTLTATAGLQVTALIPNNQSRILLNKCDPAGGGRLAVQVDGTVASLVITGCYKVAD